METDEKYGIWLGLNEGQKGLEDAEQALLLDPSYVKAS